MACKMTYIISKLINRAYFYVSILNTQKMKDISIEEQLKDKGIHNTLLLEAFQDIPEAFFLSENLHPYFYEDVRIEKAIEKTEPRVIVVARMLEQLQVKEEENILIIGVDSVYILAVLSKIYKEVYALETTKTYSDWALEVLKNIDITNVHIKTGKLENGWKTKAPFNAILSASEFDQEISAVIDSGNFEFGIEFTPSVNGKITAISVQLPDVNSNLRVTFWDTATETVLRTENVNVAEANTDYIFSIDDLNVTTDTKYMITMNSDDWFNRTMTSGEDLIYPITVGNIEINSYGYNTGDTQTYPTSFQTSYYAGDLDFTFQQTE